MMAFMGPREREKITDVAGLARDSVRLTAAAATAAATAMLHVGSPLRQESSLPSPSDSEGTEFFDAHEEMPWTPDRPMRSARRSPAATVTKRPQLGLWPEGLGPVDSASGQQDEPQPDQDPYLNSSNYTRNTMNIIGIRDGLQARAGDELSTSTPGVASELGEDTEQNISGLETRRSSNLRSLFPSRERLSVESFYSRRSLPRGLTSSPPASRGQRPQTGPSSVIELPTAASATIAAAAATVPSIQAPSVVAVEAEAAAVATATMPVNEPNSQGGPFSRELLQVFVADRRPQEEEKEEESSTASGTTNTECGWEWGHGFDPEEAGAGTEFGAEGEPKKGGKEHEQDVSLAPTAPKKGFPRIFINRARNHRRPLRENQWKKMLDMSKRALNRSRSSSGDLSATNPETEVPVPAAGLDATVCMDDKGQALGGVCEVCGESRSPEGVLRNSSCSFCAKEEKKKSEGPPVVKVQRHGKAKIDNWRSMHVVQSLRYHEGPIWTLKFNRHGTRMATGGQDGKVVVWALSLPLKATTTAKTGSSSKGGGGGGADETKNDADKDNFFETTKNDLAGKERDPIRKGSMSPTSGSGCGSSCSQSDSYQSIVGLVEGGGSDANPGMNAGKEKHRFSTLEVFNPTPLRVYTGHNDDVVDLSWSHSDFLCSASMDKTVMLWHPTRKERLGKFTHPSIVTSVQFHPLHDWIFLTGCFDKRLRLWVIPEGRVVNWVQCPDVISAASFSPDGQLTAAGLFNGAVMFHHTNDLRYYTQIHCRNRHGSNRRGKKVTGLAFVETARLRGAGRQPYEGATLGSKSAKLGELGGCTGALGNPAAGGVPGTKKDGQANNMSSQYSLLSTTNDSRLRIHDLDSFSMTCKFKGLVNDGFQIKASFSEDGMFVISGSEDGQVYLWNSTLNRQQSSSCPAAGPVNYSSAGSSAAASPCQGSSNTASPTSPAPTPPETSARVKSNISSSFSVECSSRQKVATVAVFMPSSALDAVLEMRDMCKAAGVGDGTRKQGKKKRGPARAGERKCSSVKGWRGSLCRTTFMSRGTGDDADALIRARLRRWSFAGHPRFSGVGRGGKVKQRQGGKAGSDNKHTTKVRSLSPASSRQPARSWRLGESPSETATAQPSLDSAEDPSKWRAHSICVEENPLRRTYPLGVSSADGVWEDSGKRGNQSLDEEGTVRAIVTADFNGEIKVFLGFADGLDRS